jgi:hypothetical protein
MTANNITTTAAPAINNECDPVAVVLDAAGCGLVPADHPFRWTAHRAEISTGDADAGLIAEYHFDKIAAAPGVDGADEITEEFVAGVRSVLNMHVSAPGQRWYADGPYTDEPGVIARVRFLLITDEAAAEAGLYPW